MNLLHPYYPQGLVLEAYAPNTRSAAELIGAWIIFLSVMMIVTFSWLAPKKLSFAERLTTLWFVACKFRHVLVVKVLRVHGTGL